MMKPLAVVVYENLLPGTQLVNRLQDLGYRVQALTNAPALKDLARQEKPLVVLIELAFHPTESCNAIRHLRTSAETQHVIVIAYTSPENAALHQEAMTAGATMVAESDGILDQIETLLDQALHVD